MYKQIIIVRKDLHMSSGKLAVQVAHASTAYFTNLIRKNVVGEVFDNHMKNKDVYRIETFDIDKGVYEQWIDDIFTKVVLQARNKNQLLKAVDMAKEIGLEEGKDFWLIKDSCLTELTPEEYDEDGTGRTLTCIGFRPLDSQLIDQIGKKYHTYMEEKNDH